MKEKLTLSDESITINNHSVKKIYGGFGDGQPCILAKQVAELHGYEVREINQLVNNNLYWFDEGIDIIDLKKSEVSNFPALSNFYNRQSYANSVNIYIFSQQGYALLAKLLKSELSRQIYKSVVRKYFMSESSVRWLDCLSEYTHPSPPRSGFVYAIRNPLGKVKIGKSRNPYRRIRTIQTQGGFHTNKIFISERLTNYALTENMIHNYFKEQRFIGEWFCITFEEACKVCRKIVNMADRNPSESDDVSESPGTPYKKTESIPCAKVPKSYRGWKLIKRGKNKKGEIIYNLVRKINGKRDQKYLGVWDQKKADRMIDKMNQEYGVES